MPTLTKGIYIYNITWYNSSWTTLKKKTQQINDTDVALLSLNHVCNVLYIGLQMTLSTSGFIAINHLNYLL